MRKISQKDLKRIADAKASIEEAKSKIENLIDELRSKIDEAISEANDARDDAYNALDDLASEAQTYYDERSEKWQESDAASQYTDWISAIETARDNIGEEIAIDLEQIGLDQFDEIINALEEGTIPEAPDQM